MANSKVMGDAKRTADEYASRQATSTGNVVSQFIEKVLAADSVGGEGDINLPADCLKTKDEATFWTPLQVVVQQSNFNGALKTNFNAKTVKAIIAKGADVNKGNVVTNITPLHLGEEGMRG